MMAIELEKAGEASVEKLGGDVRRAREAQGEMYAEVQTRRGRYVRVYLPPKRMQIEEQNAETFPE